MRSRSAASGVACLRSLSSAILCSSGARARNDPAELRRLAAQLFLGDRVEPLVLLVDRVDDRLDALLLAVVAGAEQG